MHVTTEREAAAILLAGLVPSEASSWADTLSTWMNSYEGNLSVTGYHIEGLWYDQAKDEGVIAVDIESSYDMTYRGRTGHATEHGGTPLGILVRFDESKPLADRRMADARVASQTVGSYSGTTIFESVNQNLSEVTDATDILADDGCKVDQQIIDAANEGLSS